jgi:hypothetical protein
MEKIISKLESKQKDLLAGASKDDFSLWLSSPLTKAFLIQLEIDEYDLCQNWSLGRYSDESQIKAQGQAHYIAALREAIPTMWSDSNG